MLEKNALDWLDMGEVLKNLIFTKTKNFNGFIHFLKHY